ncbi:MAG: DegV family EDD domain-containing protein [Deltaproteobacteria bacterium]|nr:DegV family EDD domain-containing protein [Deltaproteobacteria bacterium]
MEERIEYLDGLRFKRSIIASARRIREIEQHLNDINVFPVPDGDTGTNMVLTMDSIVQGAEICEHHSFEAVSSAIADSAFNGARGNSGAILAQFFQGLAEATRGKIVLSTQAFARAAHTAVEQARAAVSAPREGTIITVMKDWASCLADRAPQTPDFVELLRSSLKRAKDSLADTPNKLKELKRAGVVDAGAEGFVTLLEGMIEFIETGTVSAKKIGVMLLDRMKRNRASSPRDLSLRYCMECLVEGPSIDKEDLRARLDSLGGSLIVAGSALKVRFHIHTNCPEKVRDAAASVGAIAQEKIEDMAAQVAARVVRFRPKRRVAIVTDSTCDLPRDVLAEMDVAVVPVVLQIGSESYRDGVDIDSESFYRMMEHSTGRLLTSRPPLGSYRDIYDSLAGRYETILSIHLSEALSGTAEGARTSLRGASYEGKVRVFDSRAVSLSLGLLVKEAALLADQGLGCDEIVRRLEEARRHLNIYVSIPDLTYAIRGGRVSKTWGTMGKLLHIKPIISVDAHGRACRAACAFTQDAVVKKVLRLALRFAETVKNPQFNIGHIAAPETAELYRREILRRFDLKNLMINVASPVIGVHAGIGSVGIAVLGDGAG